MTEATHTPDNHTNPASAAPKRRKDTRKGDRHSPGYRTEWMRRKRAKDKVAKEAGK